MKPDEGAAHGRARLESRCVADRDVVADGRRAVSLPAGARGALADAEPDQLAAAGLAMQRIKAVAAADIARFERDQPTRGAASVTAWLTSLLQRYETWLKRLSPP